MNLLRKCKNGFGAKTTPSMSMVSYHSSLFVYWQKLSNVISSRPLLSHVLPSSISAPPKAAKCPVESTGGPETDTSSSLPYLMLEREDFQTAISKQPTLEELMQSLK
ncbi:hypothetical protein chiPu_0021092 [Chiloscyllium punctatum]|uniref:Uncharacterized protein n=1 Tax=Chiloscyllium punctatum TaxID=137246 RepID=A0A401RN94_CHIPU|nr:hypothetical protein [Chiloscyllium punctatum]